MVVDTNTFKFLISLAINEELEYDPLKNDNTWNKESMKEWWYHNHVPRNSSYYIETCFMGYMKY